MRRRLIFESKNSKFKSKKWLFGLMAIFMTSMVSGQSVLSKIPANGKSMMSFVPGGYDTLATVKGDLNNDKLEDIAMVLNYSKESEMDMDYDEQGPRRILLILFKTPEGYKTAAKADSAILCYKCGGMYGDPFATMEIKRNVLTIIHFGGSNWKWELTHRFRYQQNDFYLIGETNYSYFNGDRCEKYDEFAGTNLKDVNYLTGQYEEKEITQQCKLLKNKKGKRAVQPLKKLSDFKIEN